MKRIKVVSLFDGIGTGRLALERAGFEVEKYIAFEIDPNPIKIARKHYPDIQEMGSVVGADFTPYKGFDLLIFGSPCQDLSAMNKYGKGLEGEKSKLFFEAVRALKEIQPKYFLMENVASMTIENRNRISEILGVEPIMIDSKTLSAQRRRRLYWTNIPNITQPENKGLVLKDIIQPTEENIYNCNFELWNGTENKRYIGIIDHGGFLKERQIQNLNFPSTCLTTFCRVFYLYEGKIHKVSSLECERLQTLPDNYTEGISKTARLKALGNGWTCDVITHIFKFMLFDSQNN